MSNSNGYKESTDEKYYVVNNNLDSNVCKKFFRRASVIIRLPIKQLLALEIAPDEKVEDYAKEFTDGVLDGLVGKAKLPAVTVDKEIANTRNINKDTEKKEAEKIKIQAETNKIEAESIKIYAEARKLNAEANKIEAEANEIRLNAAIAVKNFTFSDVERNEIEELYNENPAAFIDILVRLKRLQSKYKISSDEFVRFLEKTLASSKIELIDLQDE